MTHTATEFENARQSLKRIVESGAHDLNAQTSLFKLLTSLRIVPTKLQADGDDPMGHPAVACLLRERPSPEDLLVADALPALMQAGLSLNLGYTFRGEVQPQGFTVAFGRLWSLWKHRDADYIIGLSNNGVELPKPHARFGIPQLDLQRPFQAFDESTFPTEIRNAMRRYLKGVHGFENIHAAIYYGHEDLRPTLVTNIKADNAEKTMLNYFSQSLMFYLPRHYPVAMLSTAEMMRTNLEDVLRPI